MRNKIKSWLKRKLLDLLKEEWTMDVDKFRELNSDLEKSKEYKWIHYGYVQPDGEHVNYYLKTYRKVRVHPELDQDEIKTDMVAVYTGLDKHEFNGKKFKKKK